MPQYRLLSKGEPAPFTGVIMDKTTYDLEGQKLDKQAQVIAGQKAELAELRGQIKTYAERRAVDSVRLVRHRELTQSAQTATAAVKVNMEAVVQESEKLRPKWYERPVVWGPLGFASGSALTWFVLRKL